MSDTGSNTIKITSSKVAIALVVAMGLLATFYVEVIDGAFIVVTKEHAYDPAGYVRVVVNDVVRNCSGVTSVQKTSHAWRAVLQALSRTKASSQPAILQLIEQDGWYIAESEFDRAEQGILLLETTADGLAVRAEWSGTAAPLREEPVIRDYLSMSVPKAPGQLIACFEPHTRPFKDF